MKGECMHTHDFIYLGVIKTNVYKSHKARIYLRINNKNYNFYTFKEMKFKPWGIFFVNLQYSITLPNKCNYTQKCLEQTYANLFIFIDSIN